MTGGFFPHLEIQIPKGIPKSVIEGRIAYILTAIKKFSLRNWKSFIVPVLLDDGKELNVRACIGCTHTEDGSFIADQMSTFILSPECIHIYRSNEDGAQPMDLSIGDNCDGPTVASLLWMLPCAEFDNIWENLIYDTNLKNELLSYVYALIRLSESKVDMKIISVNRLILLLGPPGTGKTSACRGLAQNLAVRLNRCYDHSVMVEINSHSLFSKWFSESGKLVLKMFDQIDELAEDGKSMVFVLIDEVESLSMSRESSKVGGEPCDSIRAVNALLTQIDRVRRRSNVLILCTSNLEDCLDQAFLDRADIVRHVGQPSIFAIVNILVDCIAELLRAGIIAQTGDSTGTSSLSASVMDQLREVASSARGLSGRAVRQLPVLACSYATNDFPSVTDFLDLLKLAVCDRNARATN